MSTIWLEERVPHSLPHRQVVKVDPQGCFVSPPVPPGRVLFAVWDAMEYPWLWFDVSMALVCKNVSKVGIRFIPFTAQDTKTSPLLVS